MHLMRRRHSKLRMGLRGRSGFLAYVLFGTAAVVAIYYVWNNLLFSPPSKITYSSVQDVKPGHVEQWDREKHPNFVIEEPPIGLNKEIEMQMESEKWKKAKALQDRIDEERLLEEESVYQPKRHGDYRIKMKADQKEGSRHTEEQGKGGSKPLLYQQADPADGNYFSKLQRIVHLDLKGAPPLVSYLEKLFPVLRRLGATGLLLEYEDMFPYTGNLSILTSGNAYSQSDLQRIQAAAKANQLEIIPLVQTFGHMEFVLKYKQYMGLREHPYTPQVITPAKEESYHLIYAILDQILKAHPDSQRVHLGCDEVYQLGEGESNFFMTSQRLTPGQLFLRHAVRLARHLRTTYPKFRTLIWDDWLRNIPFDQLKDSGLPGLVEPVVWYYQHNILERIPPSVWDTYGKLFPAVWVASAFKGATGSAQILTNASVHVDNNLEWVNTIRTFGIQTKKVTFQGVVLTGWQRYDHFATLCELLPVGLPSLALSLQAVKNGAFGPKEIIFASHSLNCSGKLDLEFPAMDKDGAMVSQDCNFPASAVYYSVQQLWGILEVYQRDRGLQERISGWMTDYQIRHGISNPGQMKVLAHKLHKFADRLQGLINPMRDSLLQIYDASTIDEWITTNVKDRLTHIKDLLDKAKKFLEQKDWPARPFPEASQASHQVTVQPAVSNVRAAGSINNKNGQSGIAYQHGNQVNYGRLKEQSVNNNGFAPHQIVSNMMQNNPQSIKMKSQGNPQGVVNQHIPVAQNNQRQPQQGLGILQQNAAVDANRFGGKGGSILSQTFLQKPEGNKQEGPSGPAKLQQYRQPVVGAVNTDSLGRLQQKQGNPQYTQSPKSLQGFRQYVQGLPQDQGFKPNRQSVLKGQQGLPQSIQGQDQNLQRLGQIIQSQKKAAQSFQGVQQNEQNKPPILQNFGQNQQAQLQGQQKLPEKSQLQQIQENFQPHKPVVAVGPQKIGKHLPLSQDQHNQIGNERGTKGTGYESVTVADIGGEAKQNKEHHPVVLNTKDGSASAVKQPDTQRENHKEEDIKTETKYERPDRKAVQYLDSFVGQGRNDANNVPEKLEENKEGEHLIRTDKDYNADDDD